MSASALRERLRGDLKSAMRERRQGEVSVIRTLIAAIDNAEAIPIDGLEERLRLRDPGDPIGEVARRELDSPALDSVVAAEAQSRIAAAEDYERNGRADDAARLRSEAQLIARYLA
jgi:uncharacterized protein YqeY